MSGSPVFSINLTHLRIPTNPNYRISIKKSQAILQCFYLDLKSSVWFTLGSENENMCTQNFFSGRLPVVNIPNDQQSTLLADSLPSFLDNSGKGKEERGKRKAESGKRKLKKVLSVTKHAKLETVEIYKAFQDRLTFLNRHMIVWIGWDSQISQIYRKYRTSGHLVF